MIEGRGQKAEGRSGILARGAGKVVISAFCLLLSALSVAAQTTTNQYTPVQPVPLGDVLLSLPTDHIPGAGTWEIKFTHRFTQSIDQGNFSARIHSLFGLDNGADIGLGLSYVLRPRVQFSLYRSNAMDDIELAAKYIAVQQAAAIPFSAALRFGGDIRTEVNLNDRTSVFGQVILSHEFGRSVEIFVIPTFATKAGRAVSGNTSQALFNSAFNVPVGGAFMFSNGLSLVGELYPKNRDLPSSIKTDLGWAFGIKRAIGGHHFEILLTNNSATHVDQYVTSTYMGAPLNRGDLRLGFNIERRFGGGTN